jgi:hypothetical protein
MTIETETNGDSWSTFQRGPWFVRWAFRVGTIDFCPPLAALSPVQNIIFLTHTLFHFISPQCPATWAGSRVGSPVSWSLVCGMSLDVGHK